MEEIFLPVEGFEGLYEISNNGLLHIFPRQGTKGGYTYGNFRKGYLYYGFSKNSVAKNKSIHKLVYETFVGPIPEGYDVHHIDHNPMNNCVYNLELIELHRHRKEHFKLHSQKTLDAAVKAKSKPVLQYTLDGEFVAEYSSAREASRITKIPQSHISDVASGKVKINSKGCKWIPKTAGGFVFKYKEVA